MNKKCPTSVTIIAWMLIILGSLNLYSFLWAQHNPYSLAMIRKSMLPIQIVWTCFATVIYMMIGVFLLRGDHRARTAYIVVFLCGLGMRLIHVTSIAAFFEVELTLGIGLCFLYSSKANAYFGKPSKG